MEVDVLGPATAIHGRDVQLGAFRNLVEHAIAQQICGDWAREFVRRAWDKGSADAGGPATSPAAVEVLLDSELMGISAAVSQAVARVGFRHHASKAKAWQLASAIYDKEMTKRLPALIDTLTVQAYNKSKLQGYRLRGVERVGVIPELMPPHSLVHDAYEDEPIEVGVRTAGDDRVCDDCDDYASNSPYDIDEVEDDLPLHIGCRCTYFPWDDKRFRHDAEPPWFYVYPIQDVDPPDYTQDPTTGKFTGSVGHGGSKAAALKNWQPSKSVNEHDARVNALLKAPAQRNKNYRWLVNKHIDEAKEFKNEGKIPALKAKVGESFYAQAKFLAKKGDPDQSWQQTKADIDALLDKADKFGFAVPASEVLEPPGKPAPAVLTPPSEQGLGAQPAPAAGWTKIGPQLGSNPGGTYADPQGAKWYVKFQDDAHAKNEVLTAKLYELAGVAVPEQKITQIDGKTATASRIIENAKTLAQVSPETLEDVKPTIQNGFAVDAWLANRDVVGLVNDNIVVTPSGGVARLDQGGGLKYRAQGEPKAFGHEVTEFATLRDPNINKQSAAIFGSMTPQQLVDSAAKVTAIPDQAIRDLAKSYGMTAVGETLVARKDDLAKQSDVIYNAMFGEIEPEPKSSGVVVSTAAEIAAATPKPSTWPELEHSAEIKIKAYIAEHPDLDVTSESHYNAVLKTLTGKEVQALGEAPAYGSVTKAMQKLKAEVVTKPAPPVDLLLTPEQIKKASKPTAIPLTTFSSSQAKALVVEFNKKYEGKTLTDPVEIQQKIAAYSTTMTAAKALEQVHAKQAEAEAVAKYEQTMALAKAKEAEKIKALAPTPEDQAHYDVLTSILGGTSGGTDYLHSAAAKVKSAGLEGKISPAEAALILAYGGSHYGPVNKQLRIGAMTDDQYKFARGLNKALDKLPPYEGVTYRKASLPKEVAEKYKPGYIVMERGFSSSSMSKGVWSGDYRYIIHGKSGRDVSELTGHPSEKEVLFKSNTAFRVVTRDGNNIHLEEVD